MIICESGRSGAPHASDPGAAWTAAVEDSQPWPVRGDDGKLTSSMTAPPPADVRKELVMITEPLQAALDELSTERLQALADVLSRNGKVGCTVGAWHPHCPMVLAGFDPDVQQAGCPERRFARAWDEFARPAPHRRWVPSCWPASRDARLSDVQALLRASDAALAARHAKENAAASNLGQPPKPDQPQLRPRRWE